MSTSEPQNNPDDPPIFPQELFDRLIDLVETASLPKFSLVSKKWAHQSRKRIFRTVTLPSRALFKLWCKNTTPGPSGPSSFVRVLILQQKNVDKWITLNNLLEGEEHLVSFTDLKILVIFNLHTLDFRDRGLLSRCFRVIGQDLRSVRLHHVNGTPRTLTSLIQQFPKLQTLAIEYYTEALETSSEDPTDETEGQFQGCLQLLSIHFEGLAVIDSIARLPLRYEEVNLITYLHFVQSYNRLFSACAPTLERLRIIDTRKPRTQWAMPIGWLFCFTHLGERSRNRRLPGDYRRKLYQATDGESGYIEEARSHDGNVPQIG